VKITIFLTSLFLLQIRVGDDYDPQLMAEHQPFESIVFPNGTIDLPKEMIANSEDGESNRVESALRLRHLGSDPRTNHFVTPSNSHVSSLISFEEYLDTALEKQGKDIPSSNLMLKIGPRIHQRMERMLSLYTTCPLQRQWVDLGARYYPRWFKEPRCLKRESCSVPAGMHCRASSQTSKFIVWYFCSRPEPSSANSGVKVGREGRCRWLRRKVLITTACSCGCPTNNS